MNVTAHQEKKKNKETKTGKRKRKQANDSKKAVCCPSSVVQGQHSQKIKGSARSKTQTESGTAPPR